jgi:hypothetical protein
VAVRRFTRRLDLVLIVAFSIPSLAVAQQQFADPDFTPHVEIPSWRGEGPRVAIDEAHSNLHTAGGEYRPFAGLLTADGYRVTSLKERIDRDSLDDIEVVVIANARNLDALRSGTLDEPAFTEKECDVVEEWVRKGGALLLIADHAPFGQAAASLAARFGVEFGTGWVFDLRDTEITTQIVFSIEDGSLGRHETTEGRGDSERVKTVRSFTGQSLRGPDGAVPLLKLSETAREALLPDDLEAEATALSSGSPAFGSRSIAVAGRSQGMAMEFGKGRIVVLGEAGMFSAQIVRYADGRDMRVGMNVPGYDNRQFALNVMRWLANPDELRRESLESATVPRRKLTSIMRPIIRSR